MIRTAVGGSSSAPIYFDPEPIDNKYNITGHLVDGGVICNNPAFYAYSVASNLYGHKKIRVLSLGTGIQKATENSLANSDSYSKFSSLSYINDFTMNIETAASNMVLNQTMGDDFLRLQVYTEASLDTYGSTWYPKMESDGETMFTNPFGDDSHNKLLTMIRTIVD